MATDSLNPAQLTWMGQVRTTGTDELGERDRQAQVYVSENKDEGVYIGAHEKGVGCGEHEHTAGMHGKGGQIPPLDYEPMHKE
jgi:hypothetical protein